MAQQTAKFLGLTNPILRECIDNLIATSMALKESMRVMFGGLANWHATVKPTLAPTPQRLKEEIHCEAMSVDFDKYFANASNTLNAIKMAAESARDVRLADDEEFTAMPRQYDATTYIKKEAEFLLDKNV